MSAAPADGNSFSSYGIKCYLKCEQLPETNQKGTEQQSAPENGGEDNGKQSEHVGGSVKVLTPGRKKTQLKSDL